MISRKKLQSILAITLIVLLTAGCGGANGTAVNSSNSSTNNPGSDSMDVKEESDQEETTTLDETVKIEDIDWSVDEGIVDGDRFVLMEYTNNSPLSLMGFKIEFTEQAGITDEQKEPIYEEIKSLMELSDEDLEEIKATPLAAYADSECFVKSGDTIKNANLYYYSGIYYLKSPDFYSLLEPDIATIKYVNGDKIYTTYYDFHSGKYSTDSETEEANYWTTTDLGNVIPKPDTPVIKKDFIDDEDCFMFEAFGLSSEEFKSYIEECKSKGFTVDASELDDFYAAYNEEGYKIYTNYNEDSMSFSMTANAPENTTETDASDDGQTTSE